MKYLFSTILFFLVWSTTFIAYNFIGLELNGGAMWITEHNDVARLFETCFAILIAAGSVGLTIGYLSRRSG